MNTCSSCGAKILWAKTPSWRTIPIDAEPSPEGNIRLGGEPGNRYATILSGEQAASVRGFGEKLYVTHFATCPNAAKHRQ